MRISGGGRTTIPKHLRERYGLGPDAEVEVIPIERGLLIRRKGETPDPVTKWQGALKTPADVDAYLEEVRGR